MARGRMPKSGKYVGTGAVINIDVGFRPVKVEVVNDTDGDVMAFVIDGMAADKAIDIAAAVANNASGGLTITPRGFSVGADYSESGKTFFYIAY